MSDARKDAERYAKEIIADKSFSEESYVDIIEYALRLERDRAEREKPPPGAVEKICEWGVYPCNTLWFRYCPFCGGKIVPKEVSQPRHMGGGKNESATGTGAREGGDGMKYETCPGCWLETQLCHCGKVERQMTKDARKDLPYICDEHPGAQIRHEWNRTQYVQGGGYPMGKPIDTEHQYFCNECGKELAPPMEVTP